MTTSPTTQAHAAFPWMEGGTDELTRRSPVATPLQEQPAGAVDLLNVMCVSAMVQHVAVAS